MRAPSCLRACSCGRNRPFLQACAARDSLGRDLAAANARLGALEEAHAELGRVGRERADALAAALAERSALAERAARLEGEASRRAASEADLARRLDEAAAAAAAASAEAERRRGEAAVAEAERDKQRGLNEIILREKQDVERKVPSSCCNESLQCCAVISAAGCC